MREASRHDNAPPFVTRALGMNTPVSRYQPSKSPYAGRRQEANYEDRDRVRTVKQRSMVRWKNRDPYVNYNLEGRWTWLEEIGKGWQLAWFHDYPVASAARCPVRDSFARSRR